MAEITLGLVGPAWFVERQARIASHVPGVSVRACWCGEPAPSALPATVVPHADPDGILRSPGIQAVAVGAPIAERAYWCEQVARAGKTPLCPLPPGRRRAEVSAVLASCSSLGFPVHLVDSSGTGPVGRALSEGSQRCGRVLFFYLEMQVDRRRLEGDEQGVLLQSAVGYLGRLTALCGALDSVWAETRSLRWGRPAEDIAVAYLRGMDGCEGSVVVDGLGAASRTRVRLHGRRSTLDCVEGPVAEAAAWRAAYAELAGVASSPAGLRLSDASLDAGMALAQWIVQAARARRPLYHREVDR